MGCLLYWFKQVICSMAYCYQTCLETAHKVSYKVIFVVEYILREQLIARFLKFYHNMIDCNNDIVKFIAKKTDGHSSRVIGRNLSMLRSEYNINPNCISRDVFVSNLFIRLSDNEEERYTGALVRDFCNARDRVCFLDISKEDINNIIDTACIM